jgi:hypothetical protein
VSDKISDIMSFKEYIETMSGSGIIYGLECNEIMNKWKTADWSTIDEFIAPIVSEILICTADEHRNIYEKIMNVVIDAYCELSSTVDFPNEPDKPKLIRIK